MKVSEMRAKLDDLKKSDYSVATNTVRKKKRKRLPGTSLVEMGIRKGVKTVRGIHNAASRATVVRGIQNAAARAKAGKAPGSLNSEGLLKAVRDKNKKLKEFQ